MAPAIDWTKPVMLGGGNPRRTRRCTRPPPLKLVPEFKFTQRRRQVNFVVNPDNAALSIERCFHQNRERLRNGSEFRSPVHNTDAQTPRAPRLHAPLQRSQSSQGLHLTLRATRRLTLPLATEGHGASIPRRDRWTVSRVQPGGATEFAHLTGRWAFVDVQIRASSWARP
jgi:hypothetical protein